MDRSAEQPNDGDKAADMQAMGLPASFGAQKAPVNRRPPSAPFVGGGRGRGHGARPNHMPHSSHQEFRGGKRKRHNYGAVEHPEDEQVKPLESIRE